MSNLFLKASAALGTLVPSLGMTAGLTLSREDASSRMLIVEDQKIEESEEEIELEDDDENMKDLLAKGYTKVCQNKNLNNNIQSVCAYIPPTETPKSQTALVSLGEPDRKCKTESGTGNIYSGFDNATVTVCFSEMNSIKASNTINEESVSTNPELPKSSNPTKKEDKGPRIPTFWEILYELWKAFTSTDRLRAF